MIAEVFASLATGPLAGQNGWFDNGVDPSPGVVNVTGLVNQVVGFQAALHATPILGDTPAVLTCTCSETGSGTGSDNSIIVLGPGGAYGFELTNAVPPHILLIAATTTDVGLFNIPVTQEIKLVSDGSTVELFLDGVSQGSDSIGVGTGGNVEVDMGDGDRMRIYTLTVEAI